MSRPSPHGRTVSLVWLLVALALGAALRWHHLGWENAWLDEAYSIGVARGSLTGVLDQRWVDIHPPLYYLALHYWVDLAGSSETAARLLSAILNLATIVIAWAIAARLADRPTAATTAMLLAVSPFHVEFAQEARMYALLAFGSTASMLAFLTLTRSRRPAAIVWYILATTLMVYSHIYSLFILAAQAMTMAVWWLRDRRSARDPIVRWLIGVASVIVLYSPWIAVLANQLSRVQAAFWIPPPRGIDVFYVFYIFGRSLPLTLALVALAVLGLAWWPRAEASSPSARSVVIPWLVAPILLPFLASWVTTPIFLPKYAIAASVPFTMLAAHAVVHVRRWSWRVPIVAGLTVLTWMVFTSYYGSRRREGWKDAVATVERLARPDDTILFYPGFNQIPFDFYRQRADLIELPFPLEPMAPVPDPQPLQALTQDATFGSGRVWLVALQGARERVPIAAALARDRRQAEHIVSEWIEMDLFVPAVRP